MASSSVSRRVTASKFLFAALAALLLLAVVSTVALANHESLDVCCAWNGNLENGELTYSISGGDELAQETVQIAVQAWAAAVDLDTHVDVTFQLTPIAASGNPKADIRIKLKNGGGVIAGKVIRHFDGSFVKSVNIQISGKAFGDPNNQATIGEIARHEVGHALGVGHATFDDLMDPVVGGVATISSCDVAGVLEANRWVLLDNGPIPIASSLDEVDCGTGGTTPDDMLVSSVAASPDPATQGDLVTISIDVANHGDNDATFTVKADVSGPSYFVTGTTDPITLSSGASTVVRFTWDTSAPEAPAGSYTISGTTILDGDDVPSNDSASTGFTLNPAGEEEPNCPPRSNSPKCR